ncbi:MAG: PilC/PilY family type IV pilus protein [Thermoanaerobaculia bacterium]
MLRESTRSPRINLRHLMLAAAVLGAALAAIADDRDLLRETAANPYAFFIMDTSGSMNWTAPCTERDAALDIDPWDGQCTRECTMGDAVCEQFDPGPKGSPAAWDPSDPDAVKCIEFNVKYDEASPPTYNEILMDEESSGGVTRVGTWSSSTTPPFVGARRVHDNNTGKGLKSIEFKPNISESGFYHVYLFYEGLASLAQNTLVTIDHAGGTDIVRANQRNNNQEDSELDAHPGVDPEHYNYLGTFPFQLGSPNRIEISNAGTDGYVLVDSLRLVSVSRPGGVACLRTGYRHRQPLCPRGDCFAPASADDPASKNFQVKEAVFEVLKQTPDVQYGFGTYEQDDGRVQGKHWLYRVLELDPFTGGRQSFFTALTSTGEFPLPGTDHVFGQGPPYNSFGSSTSYGWNCNSTGTFSHPEGDLDQVACIQGRPADADDLWEMERARRAPKLGPGNLRTAPSWSNTDIYYREPTDTAVFTAGQVYRAHFHHVSGSLGDQYLPVEIILRKCARGSGQNPDCANSLGETTRTFYFELVTDYVSFEFIIGRDQLFQNAYFHNTRNITAQTSGTPSFNTGCNGLEPNDDRDAAVAGIGTTQDDLFGGYTHKWETATDPDGRGILFGVGDFVPFDWKRTHQELLMGRMAPNLFEPTTGVFDAGRGAPDFRTATYWSDSYKDTDNPTGSGRLLRLKEAKQAALMPFGATPLANSLFSFQRWWAGAGGAGFADIAKQPLTGDPLWGCRDNYVLFLTDGNETCGGDPCAAAKGLFELPAEEQVLTYVIGFGLDDSTSNLGCIALEGGTVEPILPRNKQELVDALANIFKAIVPNPVTFASASVPAVQSASADKIYTSSFVPLPELPVWPGEINAFRRPLPLDIDNKPDTSRECTGSVRTGCHLWDAGEVLLEQAPTDAEIDDPASPVFRIGDGLNERRVFYSVMPTTLERPAELTVFRPPTNSVDLLDLRNAMVPTTINLGAVLEDEVETLVKQVLRRKPIPLEVKDLFDPQTEFVMGDVFHADPVVIETPSNFRYFSSDLCGLIQDDRPNNCVAGEDRGYRQFAQRHSWRRRMLATAANDGQLHFFDIGVRREIVVTLDDGQRRTVEVLTDGTGKELFSYMPRLALPIVGQQFAPGNQRQIYSLDGSLSVSDVFIDPVTDSFGAIAASEREWRTVLIAGMRRGGARMESALPVTGFYPGIFALDITQPDVLKRRDNGTILTDPTSQSLDQPPVPDPEAEVLPGCLRFNYSGAGRQIDNASCPHPFPMELWIFNDSCYGSLESPSECSSDHAVVPPAEINAASGIANPVLGIDDLLDEDRDPISGAVVGNGEPDLGQTWSQPVIAQIALCSELGTACDPDDPNNDGDLTSKFVAIFGGGIDPANKAAGNRGNWLYMVDVETGQAIYKRQLEGAAPSAPAVIDTDRDGLHDLVYIGTTAGILYKLDLGRKRPDGNLPGLRARDDITDMTGRTHTFLRVDDDGAWDPDAILETWDDGPIYLPPAVFHIPALDRWGVAVGTGDREDILDNSANVEGRFYVFVDGVCNQDTDGDGRTDVLVTDSCLVAFDSATAPPTITLPSGDVVLDPGSLLVGNDGSGLPGWFMRLDDDFRLANDPFLTFGVLVFSMFNGDVVPSGVTDLCGAKGVTRTFAVQVENANPVAQLTLFDPATSGGVTPGQFTAEDRYFESASLTTPPFVETTANEQPGASGSGAVLAVDVELSKAIQQTIRGDFPRGTRFNPVISKLVVFQLSDGSPAIRIPIPIGIYPADWGEP